MKSLVVSSENGSLFKIFEGDMFTTVSGQLMTVKEILDHKIFPISATIVSTPGSKEYNPVKTYDTKGRLSKLRESQWDIDMSSFGISVDKTSNIMDQEMSNGFDVINFIKEMNE